ncbi:hypothetical protein GW755_01995 [bacterium]|nr:hypothetical protein [bacterium]
MLLNFLFSLALIINPVYAHEPVTKQSSVTQFEASKLSDEEFYSKALELGDPSEQSLALYGNLTKPGQISLYTFTPSKNGEVPIEVLVPVRFKNLNFKPSYFFLAPNIKDKSSDQLDIPVPENYGIKIVNVVSNPREVFYEPFSLERLYKGRELKFIVTENTKYFVGVFEPNNYIGDYSLGIGTVENFKNVSKKSLFVSLFKIKMGIVGETVVMWQQFFGTLLMVIGLIIGLGAVTVIDLHGFLGRYDPYWLKASISAHKITKPLIWLGTIFLAIGGVVLNWQGWFTGVALFQLVLLLIMLINGSYLSFVISPKLLKLEKVKAAKMDKSLQRKIAVAFVVSFITWWLQVLLLVWNVIVFK